jgi:crossover junction endodeoxyribonuclease RuvC
MTRAVVGIDLSLTATGIALFRGIDPTCHPATLSAPKGMSGMERLDYLTNTVRSSCEFASIVVFEGLSYGSNDPSAQERAGLSFILRRELWLAGINFILVPPTTLKKFVTGKGNAEKNLVLREVYKRWGVDAANDNEADAVGLLYVGLALTGQWEPTTDAQREVLETLRNPKVKAPRKRRAAA